MKPVFDGEVAEELLDACVVEYCLTYGNDDDSSTDFDYDDYVYDYLAELWDIMEYGDTLSVHATVAPDEAALRKAPRLMLRIRNEYTDVTFGYQICTFTCPNYILVNGKPLFAESGSTVEIDPSEYLPAGEIFTGWNAQEDVKITYDSNTGKVTFVLPPEGQPDIKLNSTARPLENPQEKWSFPLKKGWNLIATGLYELDALSRERLSEFCPYMFDAGGFVPMEEYRPAQAYWVYSDEDQMLELSGFRR